MSNSCKPDMTKREGIVFGCLVAFLLLPNMVGTFVAQDLLTIGQRIIYMLTSLAIYASGLCLMKRRTFLYVASLGFLLSAIELVHLIINHATTSLLFVFTIIKSEKGEFLELLSTYWFVLVIFFSLWGVYYYLAHRYVRQEYIAPLRARLWGFGIIVLFLLTTVVGLKLRPKFWNMFNIHGQDMRTAAWVGVEKACPVNMFLSIYDIVDLGHRIAEQKEELSSFRFDAQYVPSKPQQVKDNQPVVVFLIGETSRYDHWQLNGYERETSPCLMARDSAELVSFDSVFSVANLTTVSVPFILSRATPADRELYLHEASVVDAFHEAGYRTAWIADQSFNNHFLMRIAENCDYQKYVTDPGEEIFVDTVLLAPLRTQLRHNDVPQFIALHSLGCHFKYSARYPEEFQRYTPDMSGMDMKALFDKAGGSDEAGLARLKPENMTAYRNLKAILINSYDNAILYTDFFIDCVIRELEQTGRPAVLVYVGDHGENLLDDERHMFLHGTYSGSYYEYHVPLFVWTNEKYRKLYPEKTVALQHNRHKLTSTMCLFYSLLDLGSVQLPEQNPQLSFADTLMQAMDTVWGLDANLLPMPIPTRP
ncbi:MAG: phosphoethanolamine transferase [Paludibacteraceae bacterium]|nr:phosphoethanolamine transferase [Paludibacteraceae bacterium]